MRASSIVRYVTLTLMAAAIAGCNLASREGTPDNIDTQALFGGGSAILMNVGGQSAMLASACVRRSGTELKTRAERGDTTEQLRSYLRDTCAFSQQSAVSANVARPSRGRLFAPLQHTQTTSRAYSASSYYYTWYLDPLYYWSSIYSDNVNFCNRLFYGAWNNGNCFDLFSYRSYQYYRPYCLRNCFVTPVYAQTATTPSTTTTPTTSSSGFAANQCVLHGCYGQYSFPWAY